MQLLPSDLVRVQTGAQYQRATVDVSSNLTNWLQMTNVDVTAGQITFVNDPQQSDPARFFRIADADTTFAIAGYVDAGQLLGGVAGATITENVTGTSVKSDANGFFHFNQRFTRTSRQFRLTAAAEGRDPVERLLRPGDYGSFSVMHMNTPGLARLSSTTDETYHFKVTGGPRAGLEYSMRHYFGHATVTGGVTGEGEFYHPPFIPNPDPGDNLPLYIVNIGPSAFTGSHLLFSSAITNGNMRTAFFSGIPSTNGTLAGNGIVTWDATIFAPGDLNGKAYQIGADTVQFTNNVYRLIRNDVAEYGAYSGFVYGNTWRLSLSSAADPRSSSLDLSFSTTSNGVFTLTVPDGPAVTGEMHGVAFPSWSPSVIEPTAPSKLRFVVGEGSGIGPGTVINMVLSGGTSGMFTAVDDQGDSMGRGPYTYSVTGPATAQLHLTYPEFNNDYDDVTLSYKAPPGSTVPSTFSGRQVVSGDMYPYNGTFTYE
ncbi:MAG TPA: hypothetical protein VM680_12025 [Verrucomicrobiae bacterium]|nr:hypothetical protein [Verrucomicrobiae bacterium]